MIKTAGDLITAAQARISTVDVAAAHQLFTEAAGDALIIDVREADSAAKSKLADSVNISRGLLEMKVCKHCSEPDRLILTHCAGGGRASLAAQTLQDMGYTNVHAITAPFEDIKSVFG